MKIVVCVKYVPDAQSERSFQDNKLVRSDSDVLNEIDENAIELAVEIGEEYDAQVIALTAGNQDSQDALRRALQMGADEAVHINDEELQNMDIRQTATVIKAAIEKIQDVDLVITSMASSDSGTSMFAPAVAAATNMPYAGLINSFELQGNQIVVKSTADDYDQSYKLSLPAVISVTDQINQPRYPNFKAIAAARKKPIETWSLQDLDLSEELMQNDIEIISIEKTAQKQAGTIIHACPQASAELAAFIKEKLGK